MSVAIVTDVALIEAAALLERRVVTPSTLFAANSLAQAVILHDQVLLGMTGTVGMRHEGIDFVAQNLERDFARRPTISDFSADALNADSGNQTFSYWIAPDRITANSLPNVEIAHFSVVEDFLRARRMSDIIGASALLDSFGVAGSRSGHAKDATLFSAFNAEVMSKGGQPLSPDDLLTVRDMAWLAAAGYTASRVLNFEVYHALIERPFYADQLKRPLGPLELVQRASVAIEPEEAWFGEISIPPFFGMILSDQRFSSRDFWSLLIDARDRNSKFRGAIGSFQAAFGCARTKGEQQDILNEYNRAWTALIERQEYFAKERILYIIADAAKTLGKSLLDQLVKLQRFESAVGKVGGLAVLWQDMRQIAPNGAARDLLGRHFGSVPSAEHWNQVSDAVKRVNTAAALSAK